MSVRSQCPFHSLFLDQSIVSCRKLWFCFRWRTFHRIKRLRQFVKFVVTKLQENITEYPVVMDVGAFSKEVLEGKWNKTKENIYNLNVFPFTETWNTSVKKVVIVWLMSREGISAKLVDLRNVYKWIWRETVSFKCLIIWSPEELLPYKLYMFNWTIQQWGKMVW